MRGTLCLLLAAVCVIADKNADRRTKPFVADAVGNVMPPPQVLPATVGSPVNLLTPDRYEFYTFDESGELVKRLMTLEEIQAIVAAGEDTDGLVTFANENQPTIAFNFSQPPFTKVHSVVTNVQNVLKAQMEAHKKMPQLRPTFDTPDVSDSWSLILPSIFGNTGVDINPDKATTSFTPETETFDDVEEEDEQNQLSKEGGTHIVSSTVADEDKITKTPSSTTTLKPSTTSAAPTTTSSTTTTTTTTTQAPPTTEKPRTTQKVFTSNRARPTTSKPLSTRPVVRFSPKSTTTTKPTTTTKRFVSTTTTTKAPITENPNEFEKISTFIPISTVKYITERTTRKPVLTTKPIVYASTTKRSPSTTSKPQIISTTVQPKTTVTTIKPTTETTSFVTPKEPVSDKINATTLTTQSVSPSTAISSTEFISSEQKRPDSTTSNGMKDTDSIIPMFDVAQSISQIASDLGNNYQPLPTTSNLLETTKINEEDMESKENLDLDIPSESDDRSNNRTKNEDNFIKISTIDPHAQQEEHKIEENKTQTIAPTVEEDKSQQTIAPEVKITTESATTESLDISSTASGNSDGTVTTIDPILESMDDLLSQVVNEAPQAIMDSKETLQEDKEELTTTESANEITTERIETTSLTPTTSTSTTTTTTTAKVDVASAGKENPPPKTEDKVVQENKLSLDNNINKINTIEKNKVNIPGKLDGSNHKNNDFIQISMNNNNPSQNKSSTKTTDVKDNKDTSNDTKITQIIMTTGLDNKSNDEQTTKKPVAVTTQAPIEITTKISIPPIANDKISQSNINKINSADKTTNKHEKFDTVPKIEEFKKKIQKVNIADEELLNERNNSWKLIPTVTPPKANELPKDKNKIENPFTTDTVNDKNVVLEYSKENQGLEVTTKDLGEDIAQFTELCNELAFRYWQVMVENIDKRRSFVLSPYSITSMLAMMFMGARGATSGEMNDILKLDDMVTFNPHFTLKNISDSIETTPESGIIVSAFIRELYSDRNKGKILTFYKERAQHFYNGHVEEVNFKLISDIIRRRTNLLVKRYTWGKITEYMKTNSISMTPPLAAFSANIFHTDCTGSSVDGRDGEMYFVVSPNIRQRRLVPVPAVVFKSGFLAGYDPNLDATVAALGNTNSIVSTIFVMPGQQGNIVHSDDLEKLEQRLLESNPTTPVWKRVLRTLLPRVGLELQIPRFSHKSVFNVTSTLQEMGLKDLFDADHADLGGLNGPSKDLYLSDMVQMTSFVTCGEGMVGEQHHVEEYPEASGLARRRTYRWVNDWDEPRDYQRAFHDPHDVGEAMHLPLHLRPRQARLPTRSVQSARLKFDRPFLFFVRHNFSGMILYAGRYNPRLLP